MTEPCPSCGMLVTEGNPNPCQKERCDAYKVLEIIERKKEEKKENDKKN